jgi:hypothetical protein
MESVLTDEARTRENKKRLRFGSGWLVGRYGTAGTRIGILLTIWIQRRRMLSRRPSFS